MKQNRLTWLAGLLVALIAMAWITGVFDDEPTTIDVPDVEIPAEQLSAFEISSPDYTATLSREGGRWMVSSPVMGLADSLVVGRLVDSVRDLELASVVSNSLGRHANYGVDSASARLLRLDWPNGSATMAVSAQGADFGSSYVVMGDAPQVYSATRVNIPSSLDQLRDKTLANIDAPMAIAATVSSPDFAYRMEYGADGWMLNESESAVAADSAGVVQWLRRFSPLRFDGFRDDLSSDDVDVTHSIRIETITGAVTEISLGTDGDDLVAFVGGGPVMRAVSSRLASLFEEPADLREGS